MTIFIFIHHDELDLPGEVLKDGPSLPTGTGTHPTMISRLPSVQSWTSQHSEFQAHWYWLAKWESLYINHSHNPSSGKVSILPARSLWHCCKLCKNIFIHSNIPNTHWPHGWEAESFQSMWLKVWETMIESTWMKLQRKQKHREDWEAEQNQTVTWARTEFHLKKVN